MMNRFLSLVVIVALLLLPDSVPALGATAEDHPVQAELVPETAWVRPGAPFTVALRLRMEPHWHTYWRYPGDVGLPTKIDWDLPPGFEAGSIQWPHPQQIPFSGLINLGYEDEVMLLTEITPSESVEPGQSVRLGAEVSWLVCKEACIPGDADLSVELPVRVEPPPPRAEWAERFAEARSKLPLVSDEWEARAWRTEKQITLELSPPSWFEGAVREASFLPYHHGVTTLGSSQQQPTPGDAIVLTMEIDPNAEQPPTRLEGIVLSETGWRGPDSEKALHVSVPLSQEAGSVAAGAPGGRLHSVPLALLFAFAGGIILNLMPCVFPILSVKIMGFVKQAGESQGRVWRHGLLFTTGVVVSFWILAGVLIGLRAAGEQIGWGFQLQSPPVVVVLASVMFLFALNLFGVYEIGTSLTGVGGSVGATSSLWGSFLSGFLATVIATPCTAPLMGAALGFGLTQPPAVSFAIFTFLALGMASPYMVLALVPRLLRFLPKPGPWMVTLKQFFGFMLMATVVWLAWVLSLQAGATALVALFAGFTLMGAGCWVYGRWSSTGRRLPARWTARAIALALLAAGLGLAVGEASTPTAMAAEPSEPSGNGIAWEPFSPERLTQLREQGKPIFIDFTAAWCLSCQVNERVAFTGEVKRKLNELGITPLKADWTRKDETITRALARYGRSGVPLYVLYGRDPDRPPILLPVILTPKIVLDALERLEQTGPLAQSGATQ